MQAPAWLPYRLRSRWDHRRVLGAIRGLRRTPPMRVASASAADAEIHMLLCRRDVEIGVLALKSLLRFGGASWSLAITEDGSLTSQQRSWIDAHVPGARWLPRVVSDPRLTTAFATRPRLGRLYEGAYQPMRKLIHPALLSDHAKVLVLDPDTLFSRAPTRLLDWARGTAPTNLFLHDHQDESTAVPAETREAFEVLRARHPGRRWSMPSYFFNSGLLAYHRDACDLDVAEDYLAWLETAPERYTTGKPGLWFGAWTPEQTAYQLMFATMTPPAEPFGDDYRIGRRDGFTFNHFLWLQLVMAPSLAMLRRVVDELTTKTPGRN